MDGMLWETLENWKRLQGSNEQQANVHLLLLLRHTLEKSCSADAASLDRLRYGLEQTLDGKKPDNWGSYNLGMAKALNYFLQYQTTEKMKATTAEVLPPLEKKVVLYLAQAPQSKPTEIAKKLEIASRQQISNLLRSLRAKQLIDFTEIGKNRWYVLTQAGIQAYEQIKGSEELSVTSVPFYDHLMGAVEIFKRKVREKKAEHKRDLKARIELSQIAEASDSGGAGPDDRRSEYEDEPAFETGRSFSPGTPRNRIASYLRDLDREGAAHR